jgi:PKHD-type hydroxylase
MYKKISNNPEQRAIITNPYTFVDDFFSEEEIDGMCNLFSNLNLEQAGVGNKKDTDTSVRTSKVAFIEKNILTADVFDKMNYVIETINDQYYNFDLNGYERFQYTEYLSEDSGEYKFHMDTDFSDRRNDPLTLTRKLSVVMCLNRPGVDFEGGQFYMTIGSEKHALEVEMKRGRIIMFPSFMIHRVAPVTKGVRKSLVTWVTGPKFR